MDSTETLLLDALRDAWRGIAAERFGGTMKAPVLTLHRADRHLGRWTSATRTLSMSWRLVVEAPWGEVVSVLEHEMAHQYVDEVLGIRVETPHGPAFRAVCAERGIDARAAGTPVDGGAPEPKVVRRIRKLLALADSPNEAEARAAMTKAFELMLRHNVSEAEASAAHRYVVRQLGEVRARRPKHEHLLAGLMSGHFFVDVTLVPGFSVATGQKGRAVEIAGTAANVELAAYAWDFVLHTGEALWRARRQAGGGKGRFLEGLVLGFRERLEGEAARCAQEEGLVWAGDASLDRFVAARHPRRRRGRRLSVHMDADHAAGRSQGRALVFRRPIRERQDGPTPQLPGPTSRG